MAPPTDTLALQWHPDPQSTGLAAEADRALEGLHIPRPLQTDLCHPAGCHYWTLTNKVVNTEDWTLIQLPIYKPGATRLIYWQLFR